MKRTPLVSLAAAGAAVALIAGCSPAPSMAAQVEDRTISLATLDGLIDSCVDAGLPWDTEPKGAILSSMVLMEATHIVAEERNLGITNEDANVVFQNRMNAEQLAPHQECADYARDSGFLDLVLAEVSLDDFLQDIAAMDVVVNPRFGEWYVNPDDAQNPLGIGGSGSLSVTTE